MLQSFVPIGCTYPVHWNLGPKTSSPPRGPCQKPDGAETEWARENVSSALLNLVMADGEVSMSMVV
jgi:hypothetical protein